MLELAAGMERGEDHLQRARLASLMLVDRDATAVVLDRNRGCIRMQRDPDIRGVAVHRLVDGVVEDFPDKMVQASRPDAADIHSRAFSDGLETFENRDVFGRVVRGSHVYNVGFE